MADVTVTAAKVSPIPGQKVRRGTLAEAAGLGDLVYTNSAGTIAKADASTAATCKGQLYIIVGGPVKNQGGSTSYAIGDVVTLCWLGPVPGFSSLDETKMHYVSDTAGKIADTPGTVVRPVGYPSSTEVFMFNPAHDAPSG